MATRDELPTIDAARLRRLWPHRTHESSWLKDLVCALGFHRWYPMEVSGPDGTLKCTFCRWCTEVKVAGR
jgi:hypothetical protein